MLTPLAVDPAHPFPYISGLSLNLAVVVRNPSTGNEHFARVKVPQTLGRFAHVRDPRFVPLEDVIAAYLDELFPGMEVLQSHGFRVTRNEDLEVEEDDAENLLQALEKELMRRRFGPPVRLEVEETIDPHVLELLVRELGIETEEVVSIPGPLDLTGLHALADLKRPELDYPAFVPRRHPQLSDVETADDVDVLAAMRARDVLLHHPYDSFSTSVQAFLEQAADDPDVLAIKQTLYRTSGDSPIVDALIEAAEAGKQVLVLVEIKARFDEQANIKRARKLEQAGCHVVYGLVGLKTHCKLSLVVRQEGETIRRYTHVGTGNYHPRTARMYEDLGLLTSDPVVGEDVSNLFNTLSGYSRNTDYDRLLVAPHSIRSGLVERIEREIAHHEAGRPAGVRIKLNSIVDEGVIDALYRASMAGVPVDVWVRGICALRPGVPGLSETMRVRSILGRFLEHSRIFWFANGGEPDVWIGSADMMHRNLDRRVEALVQITDPSHRSVHHQDARPRLRRGHGLVAPRRGRVEPQGDRRRGRAAARPPGVLRGADAAPGRHHRPVTAERHPETERKFRVHGLFRLPELAGGDGRGRRSGAAGVADVRAAGTVDLLAVYYDTADLRLARSRVSLRRREGGADEGWHLKLPTAERETREELRCPLGPRAPDRPRSSPTSSCP